MLGVDPRARCRRAACPCRAGCASRAGRARGCARCRRSSKPASRSRSAAAPRTSPCAHGQALIPHASTPTTRRTRVGRGRGDPDQRRDLLRREPGDRRAPLERILRLDPHLGAQRRAGARRCAARCAPRASRRGTPRRSRPRRSPPRRAPGSATCARPSAPDRGRRCRRSRAANVFSWPSWRIRIAFWTPVTPARRQPERTSGADACRSTIGSLRSPAIGYEP